MRGSRGGAAPELVGSTPIGLGIGRELIQYDLGNSVNIRVSWYSGLLLNHDTLSRAGYRPIGNYIQNSFHHMRGPYMKTAF